MIRTEPSLPMCTAYVPYVRGATVGFEPQQFLEIDGLALRLKLVGTLFRGVHQGLLTRRHAPACHRKFAAGVAVPHDRRRIIRIAPGIEGRLPVRSFVASTPNSRRIASTFAVIE
jgi:hypothetical protein